MNHQHIGFLHPGAMGVSVAASTINSGRSAYWLPENRSQATQDRAASSQLIAMDTLQALCERCSLIVSVCPPHAAHEVAQDVISASFAGVFVDANAIAPQRTSAIASMMADAGIDFVDGGIIGGPAWTANTTTLYLSGQHSQEVADCFLDGPLACHIIDAEIGKASALKMCYAAYSKGSTALLAAVLGLAEQLQVREYLEQEWSQDGADFLEKSHLRTRRVTAKAWRFSGEMREIASTFEQAELPNGFHLAASDIYQRMSHFKHQKDMPELDRVLSALLAKQNQPQ